MIQPLIQIHSGQTSPQTCPFQVMSPLFSPPMGPPRPLNLLLSDWVIWTGDEGCTSGGYNCHAEAYFLRDNRWRWTLVEAYVRNCAKPRDKPSHTATRRAHSTSSRWTPTCCSRLVGRTFHEIGSRYSMRPSFKSFEYLIVAEYVISVCVCIW